MLIEEVNRLTGLIDNHITDITSTESTKMASLVENLKEAVLNLHK